MNIGIISTCGNKYTWAGSEETWKIFAEYAMNQGHNITCLLSPKLTNAPQVQNLKNKGAVFYKRNAFTPITRRLANKRLYSRYSKFFKLDHDIIFLSMGSVADAIWSPDLIHLINTTSIPVVVFAQANMECLIDSEEQRIIARSFYENVNSIIFLSDHNKSLLERQIATKLNNSHKVMNPLTDKVNGPLPWPISTTLKMAQVARLEVADKLQDQLIEALSSNKWKQRDWELSFYGNGPDHDHILKLINMYELDNKIKIAGFVSDFKDIWKKNHIHILATRREGMPLSLIESMSCGRPALVTHAGGSSEVVQNEVNGFIASGMHPQIIEETLDSLWAQKEKLEKMGNAAHEHINEILLDNWPEEILRILNKEVKSNDN